MAMRRVGDLIDRDPKMSGWQRWRQNLLTLQQTLDAALPADLRGKMRVAWREGSRITLTARHAAIAAKLRQLVPTMARALVEAGQPFPEIHIVVDTSRQQPRPLPERKLSQHALDVLDDLQQQLPDGPLKAAVARLKGRCRHE